MAFHSRRWLVLFVLAAGVWLSSTANAKPSFNCARAGTGVEHLLCSDERMGETDRLLAAQYKQALAANPGASARDALRADQLRWLRQRDRQCGAGQRAWRNDQKVQADALDCLGKLYRERYAVLMDWIAPPVALTDVRTMDIAAVDALYPRDAGHGALWLDAAFSPDGRMLALVTPVMRGNRHDQAWLYLLDSARMFAVTPEAQGVRIGTEAPFFPRTDAWLWGDDNTLYVWTRDGKGRARILTANRDGTGDPVEQVPEDNRKRGRGADLSRSFAIADRSAASHIRGNARFVVWVQAVDEDNFRLYLGRADGSRSLLAEGGNRLQTIVFDPERSRVFYPTDQGIVRHDLATGVRQRIAGTDPADTPRDVSVATQRLAWSRQGRCHPGDDPATAAPAWNICIATMVSP